MLQSCLVMIENHFSEKMSRATQMGLFALLFTINITFAQTPADSSIAKQIKHGMQQTILNDFSGASTTFQTIISQYPDKPFGYFYLGATLQAEMLDQENYAKLDEFKALMKKTIELSRALQKKNKNDPWALFMEGSAHLYHGFMDSKTKKLWGAYRNAVKGTGRLVKAIELDSTLYDAYLGVGSYRYWKSVKTKAIAWLPFLSDEREKGIRMVRTAIEKGQFGRLVGKDQLAWILLHQKKYDEALELALENHRLYPESRFFMWTLVEIYYKSESWKEAFQLYKKLLKIVRDLPDNNHYNEITCLLRMAEISCWKGDYKLANELTGEILRLELNEDIRKRTKSKRKRAGELKKICTTELARAEQNIHSVK